MKDQKGMGHITMLISIIAILAIIGTIIYFAIINLQEQKVENYETNMLLIKGKVKILSEEATIDSDETKLKGKKLADNLEDEKIKAILEKNIITKEEEKFDKYYILDNESLEAMGLENLMLNEGAYIVNYETCEIIYTQGVKIDGELYYKLSDVKKKEEEKEKESTANSEVKNEIQPTQEEVKPQEVEETEETSQEETGE